MLKLRTMPIDHTPADDATLSCPPWRIRIIRRFGIDELPQLLHVLSGKMSLLGNRPLIEEEWYARYGGAASDIAAMRPGIISGFAIDAHRRSIGDVPLVKFDFDQQAVNLSLDYVANWSLGKDLRIVGDLIKLIVSTILGKRQS